MKRTIGRISVVAIAIALIIVFSGVAAASWLAEPTPENQTFNTAIGYDRTVTGDQGFDFWKSSSSNNLLDNPTLAFGKREVYGNVNFNKNFDIHSSTGYTPRLGSLPITPASSKKMTAYSKLAVTDVQATTITKVGMTDNPVLNYKIDAEGLKKDPWLKVELISAGVSVVVVDGSDGGLGLRTCREKKAKSLWRYKNLKVLTYFPYLNTSCLFIFH